jgi:hypothetical protein
MPTLSPSIASSDKPPVPLPPVRTTVTRTSACMPDEMNVFSPSTM